MVDFEKVNRSFIDKSYDIARLEINSYVLSNKTFCNIRMINILNNINYVYDNLDDCQKQNVLHTYNRLII